MTQANSSGLMSCLFLEVNTLFFDISVVSFPSFRCWLFEGFRWRCFGNANFEFTGFILVQPGTPSKWTEHIPVCLITLKLSMQQAAIHHCIRHSRSEISTAQHLFAMPWGNRFKSNICQVQILSNIFVSGCYSCSQKQNSDDSPLLQLSSTHFFPTLASLWWVLQNSPQCGRKYETGLFRSRSLPAWVACLRSQVYSKFFGCMYMLWFEFIFGLISVKPV